MTQEEKVLDFLKNNRAMGMTAFDARDIYGIMQMPKRIWNLKKRGYIITTRLEKSRNKEGKPYTYARYWLGGAQ